MTHPDKSYIDPRNVNAVALLMRKLINSAEDELETDALIMLCFDHTVRLEVYEATDTETRVITFLLFDLIPIELTLIVHYPGTNLESISTNIAVGQTWESADEGELHTSDMVTSHITAAAQYIVNRLTTTELPHRGHDGSK